MSTAKGTDHFSRVAQHYAQARPTYPDEMFEWLASLCPRLELAVDIGAGSGQATVALARYFQRVIGTDLSAEQIARAPAAANVVYRVAPAEATGLADHSADLVVVAQALHWFQLDHFWPEVRRIVRPPGVVAVWTYGLLSIEDDEVDRIVQHFYRDVVGPYWPPGREHVENGYATLEFPFAPVEAQQFEMAVRWDLESFLRYVRSWSSTGAMTQATGIDPVIRLQAQLQSLWNSPQSISWPLGMRVGVLR